ncbi:MULTISPECIES: HD domain-containing phosphohydrolase [unclassified Acidovorax]|uniref:HD-GYP domain-containing protein n=1 Tax=unclassified Acidovorax TaxID=2684926 RepID=UPI00023FC879|nr:HD domain-containing phosphohydrolase [Acidovorax sp. NO-1]EHL21047.1 putative metal dependent phosphohydrolase [Acidovorax sp. NO-1]
MSAHPSTANHSTEGEYEDLLSLWSDLESALSMLLSRPLQVQDFAAKVRQFDHWLQDLVAHDIDAALYLMFQLASTSTVGYSASHALVCGTLCHIMAQELQLPPRERDSLVRAALTMNIGMTRLQDELAEQRERPTAAQQEAIRSHPEESLILLQRLHITDTLWLDVVGQHHATMTDRIPLATQAPEDRLTRILGTIDRYAAMISPRKSRAGRSATDSVRAIVGQEIEQHDEVSYTLVRSIGLCPPGTFVKLDNGDTAIVLRRSEKANHPLVASLLDRAGHHHAQPSLYQTATGKPRIQSALARSAVSLELNHRTMMRLGLYAAQHSAGLRGLVSGRGAL